MDPDEIEDLINELEDLSDSGPEVDTISVGSTPKPSLRLMSFLSLYLKDYLYLSLHLNIFINLSLSLYLGLWFRCRHNIRNINDQNIS